MSWQEVETVRDNLKLSSVSQPKEQEPAYRRKERLLHNDRYTAYRQTKGCSGRMGKIDYSLRLTSKRNPFVVEDIIVENIICASCLCLHDRGWRYAESSRGIVYLCLRCKAELHCRFAGPGKADAMHLTVGRKRSQS